MRGISSGPLVISDIDDLLPRLGPPSFCVVILRLSADMTVPNRLWLRCKYSYHLNAGTLNYGTVAAMGLSKY